MVKTRSDWDQFPIAKPILKALKQQELDKPMPIQAKALKAALIENKHVLGAARTGSGKTLAYAIPVLSQILSDAQSCHDLKRRISKSRMKKEDFEMIDGNMVAVEDMIVDRIENQEKDLDHDESEIENEEESASEFESENEDDKRSGPNCIVLVPTRELAVQVKNEFDKLCTFTDIKSCCIIGGISQDKQIRTLTKQRPQIIIATPGRLHDIVQSDNVEFLNIDSVASIQSLVIDEADRMVQKGHFEELTQIIDIVKESKKFRRNEAYKVYLFSATLTFLHELPDRLRANKLVSKPSRGDKGKKTKDKKVIDPKEHTKKNKIKRILTLLGIERADTRIIDLNDDSTFGRPSSEQLSEMRINCLQNEKDLYLYYYLIQNPNTRTIVFCNSKDCLRRLSNVLKYLGFPTLTLHSEMDQKKRLSSLEKFRQRPDSTLIATDVAARGLDIKDLDSVIHYQVPKTCESYIHRSGRTARVFKKGTSITLCEPKEASYYRRLCNNINNGHDLDHYEVDLNLKALLKDRVVLAQQCDKLDHKLRETKSNTNWFMKAAKECDIELDDEDIRQFSGKGKTKQQRSEEDARDRRHLNQLQKQLKTLMRKPLVTRTSMIEANANKLHVESE